MEELKRKVNTVYNWTVEDGKPQPPKQDLPQVVKDRADYFLGNGRRWYDVYGSDGMHLR